MKTLRVLFISAIASVCLTGNGMLFYGLDNSANTSDPGTGLPFDAVARVTSTSNPTQLNHLRGTAVHLGGGYMLTANHVNTNDSTRVSFDGVTWYQRDLNFTPVQVEPNVDLKIFKLETAPAGISAAQIYTGSSENLGGAATIVGWGLGRDGTALNSSTVGWGDYTTSDKRWGINNPVSFANIGYQTGSYQALQTNLQANQGSGQAAVVDKDSGSPMFQFLDNQWYIIGIATVVTQKSGARTSTFSNNSNASDQNYFARISAYSEQIIFVIPEPGTLVLSLILLGACGLMLRPKRPENQ